MQWHCFRHRAPSRFNADAMPRPRRSASNAPTLLKIRLVSTFRISEGVFEVGSRRVERKHAQGKSRLMATSSVGSTISFLTGPKRPTNQRTISVQFLNRSGHSPKAKVYCSAYTAEDPSTNMHSPRRSLRTKRPRSKHRGRCCSKNTVRWWDTYTG
ncbi:hypothetical protein BC834DRAFT_662984 [Gloeopeniophorella convolvens]|nr:hypothetical protein BC834DRAFT_662984 [Gloeopeniophorella convolvens]